MTMTHRRLLVATLVATSAFTNGVPFPSLRSTLIHANPTLSAHKRTAIERETSTNPLQPTLRSIKFWRHVGPIVVHYKFTELWYKISRNDNPARRAETWDALHTKHAPTGLKVILELRGLYVKIGQVMSSRADFVPRQYVDVFSTLQDQAPPYEKERIERLVRDSLKSCQGVEMNDVFESFGEVLGSASIGQVHKAKLTPKYGGDTVAVKVMHPNAQNLFRNDFKVFRTLCKIALPGWDPILRELEMQMMTEFDYNNESHNLQHVRANMAKSPYANKVCVPEPMINLCSTNVLVMEFLSGKKLAESIEDRLASILGGDDIEMARQMARKVLNAKQRALFESKDVGRQKKKRYFQELSDIIGEIDDDGLTKTQKAIKSLQLISMTRDARKKLSLLLDATGHQIFQDGVYNGDPHPGNILVLDCGRLGLIDYGQTRRLTKSDRLALSEVVAALGKQNRNSKEIATAMRIFGFRSQYSNDENTVNFAALYFDSDAVGKKLGYATPQKYLMHLNSIDPMLDVPDPAIFVARTSFLFRGLGALLQQQLHTSQHWRKHAVLALATDGEGRSLYNLGLTPL
eukprot:CAMPEP_0172323202 /NCGR_PEP_ID=MMETSP1058-20130122/48138_1 /TAXON_ID=83371 /ORGANISM="Detonula confervacea, Strain CCMP 353" /LENGTH=573 /DNA_ID=CAMNT_0013039151 /DNA_START=53 /DNA_END=1774 /DNA_ORIENTATION=-